MKISHTIYALTIVLCNLQSQGCSSVESTAPESSSENRAESSAESSVEHSPEYESTNSSETVMETPGSSMNPNEVQPSSEVEHTISSSLSSEEIISSEEQETPTEYLNSLYEKQNYVFSDDTIRTYNIVISEENLTFLDDNPMQEQYVTATLIGPDDTIPNVMIRYKGQNGSWQFAGGYTEYSGAHCAQPHKSCQKLSMKIKFKTDEYPDRKFYGLKKLMFHSMNMDISQLRERLGYWIFREMGVTTSRSTHAVVQINGQPQGLYAIVEQVDSRFIKSRFEDNEGHLFKEMFPVNGFNEITPESVMRNTLKTNEDDNLPLTTTMEFAKAASEANILTIPDVIKKWMNPKEIAAHLMVTRLLRHWDSPWSPFDGWQGKNYYLYVEPNNKKVTLIPWDLDYTLHQGHAFPGEFFLFPVSPIPGNPFPKPCEKSKCSTLFGGFLLLENELAEAIDFFETDVYPRALIQYQRWTEQIRDITIEMNQKHGDIRTTDNYQWGGAFPESTWQTDVDSTWNNFKEGADWLIEGYDPFLWHTL
ncbi:MAG: CotH kinase family protein [Fibrobacterales bacterium]